ncbi:MAG: FecR domain-containing protein [Bacteroidota bacterium]
MKHEYLSYSALQLAAEHAFILWVKDEEGPHASSWLNWLAEHPEMEAKVQEAKEIAQQQLDVFSPIPHSIHAKSLWERIDDSLRDASPKKAAKIRSLRPLFLGLSLAAAIALLLFIVSPFSSETQLRSPNGQHLAFTLPDSSPVELNAASSVRYVAQDFQKRREIYLDGEAFFEVEKGDNFIVKTDLGSVRVLGTSFNVFEREGNFKVQCLSGKVEVSTPDGTSSVILLPGQTTQLNSEGKLSMEKDSIPELASWRNYVFKYKASPLFEVLEEIKRQYNVEIDFRASKLTLEKEFSGEFEGKGLEKALQDVIWSESLKFDIKGGLVIITGE